MWLMKVLSNKKEYCGDRCIIEEIDKMAKEENGAGSLGNAIQEKNSHLR